MFVGLIFLFSTSAQETRIEVEIPKIKTDLGSAIHFVRFPNFISAEPRPFDPAVYEDEIEEDDLLDEEGRTRLKLKVCLLTQAALINHFTEKNCIVFKRPHGQFCGPYLAVQKLLIRFQLLDQYLKKSFSFNSKL